MPDTTANLTANSYGKSRVRLTKVVRHADRHDIFEFTVAITLKGDFAASYTDGDNSNVIATDSMRNTVYVLAKESAFDSPDRFARLLANHFVSTYDQVASADIAVDQTLLTRITLDGKPHEHAFTGGSNEKRTARCSLNAGGPPQATGGITGLVVLKSAGSEFVDFVNDRFRTLPDSTDRIFATTVDAAWRFTSPDADPNATYAAARDAVVKTFAEHYSRSVQETLLEIGNNILAACPAVDRVDLSLPNQHRVPFNLEPFGHDNPAEIFVTTDEPAGQIQGTVERTP